MPGMDRTWWDRRSHLREPLRGERAGAFARRGRLTAPAYRHGCRRHRAHHRSRAQRPWSCGRGRGVRNPERPRPHHPSPVANESVKAMGFPQERPRRTRANDAWRRLVRETRLTADALIYPLFVVEGSAVRHAVTSMPGISQLSVDEAVKEARAAHAAGVPGVLLFAAPDRKDPRASDALDARGLAATAIAAIKEACPQLLVWVDVCVSAATDHGHCGHVTEAGVIEDRKS